MPRLVVKDQTTAILNRKSTNLGIKVQVSYSTMF